MSDIKWEDYGHAISDHDGKLRDITAIIDELEEIQSNYSTHAMSDYALFLHGRLEMLNEVIQYLKRV